MAQKYVKKPIEVEAVQWNGSNIREVEDFIGESVQFDKWDTIYSNRIGNKINKNDFIVKDDDRILVLDNSTFNYKFEIKKDA